MVQPLHRTNLLPPTRCDPMMVASSRDWNVFKQILADHWEPFQRAHPRYRTAYYESLVAKMLAWVVYPTTADNYFAPKTR
jgi:hypothetical protein